jgi:(S)-ureidoglycine aminohydrolase
MRVQTARAAATPRVIGVVMPQKGLVTSRVVVARNFAILPPEGIPATTLPGWRDTEVRILTAPAMGAAFAQYRLDVAPRGGATVKLGSSIETFFYCLDGDASIAADGAAIALKPGGFAYLPPGAVFTLEAAKASRLLWLKKKYEPIEGGKSRLVAGNERDVKGEPFMETPELPLKHLLPDEPGFDMAMNVFTFPPGFGLPMIETHVMEHGLYMLEGQGLYYLGDAWREVQAGDFIWMGPYCPQSFYATSSSPARYIYYKNVNRDVEL